MNTVGHVDQIPRSGNTFARLVRTLQQNDIRPTHFLIVQMTYHASLPNHLRSRVQPALFNFVNDHRYQKELNGPDDVVSITWKSPNQGSSMIYYATSRLDETYVRQLTDELLAKAHASILQKTDLKVGNFQMSYIVAKNLNYAVNLANGDEAAVAIAGAMMAQQPQLVGGGLALVEAAAAAAAGADLSDEDVPPLEAAAAAADAPAARSGTKRVARPTDDDEPDEPRIPASSAAAAAPVTAATLHAANALEQARKRVKMEGGQSPAPRK